MHHSILADGHAAFTILETLGDAVERSTKHQLANIDLISYNKFIKLQPFIIVFVEVLATAAAFVGTTVRQPGVAAADSK